MEMMNVVKNKIKPCPKCDDIWMFFSDGHHSGYEALGFRVDCVCGFAWRSMTFCSTREEAIIKWNEKVMATITRNENEDATD